jgi:hypothetical protein
MRTLTRYNLLPIPFCLLLLLIGIQYNKIVQAVTAKPSLSKSTFEIYDTMYAF